MANDRQNRIRRAQKEVAREQKSVDRVRAKFDALQFADKAYPRVQRDLAQQIHQLETAKDALEKAQHED